MMRSFGGKRSNAAAATTGRIIAREAAAQRLPARTLQARPVIHGIVRWNVVKTGAGFEDRSSAVATTAAGVAIPGTPRLWIDSFASCPPMDFGATVYEIELTGESVTRNGTARPKARAVRPLNASTRASEVEIVATFSNARCLVKPLASSSPITVDVDGTADEHSLVFHALGAHYLSLATGQTLDVPRRLNWIPFAASIYAGDVSSFWELQPEHAQNYRAGANDHQGGSSLSIDIGEPFLVNIGVDLRDSAQTNAVRRATVFLTVQFEWGSGGLMAKMKAPGGWCSGFDVGISGTTFTGTLTNHGGVGLTSQRSATVALTMNSSNSLTSITSLYGTIGSITLTPTQDATTGKITAISCAVSPSGVMDTATISWQTLGGRPGNRSTL